MKTNIRYSIIGVLFWAVGLSISLIGLVILISDTGVADPPWWVVIFCGVLFLACMIMLLHAISNIQWFNISNGYITIHSPFGTIKRVQLSEIKKAFKIKSSIFELKRANINRLCIVLCLKKSISKASIVDAYNAKENPYIIIPYTAETEILICSEYKKTCGEALTVR